MPGRPILVAALIIAVFAIIPATAPSADAHSFGRSSFPHCKNWLEGRVGIGVRKSKARDRAQRHWQYDAKRKYGYRYSGWGQARNNHFHCKKKAGTWRCRAVAFPCDWQAH